MSKIKDGVQKRTGGRYMRQDCLAAEWYVAAASEGDDHALSIRDD